MGVFPPRSGSNPSGEGHPCPKRLLPVGLSDWHLSFEVVVPRRTPAGFVRQSLWNALRRRVPVADSRQPEQFSKHRLPAAVSASWRVRPTLRPATPVRQLT